MARTPVPSSNTITPSQLGRLIGTPDAPTVLDARTKEDFTAAPRLLPSAVRRDWRVTSEWDANYADLPVAVVCQRSLKISQGVAACLPASHPALLHET